MAKLEVSVVIKRPVEEVFSFTNDSADDTKWSSGLVEVNQVSEGPVGVGTIKREVNRILVKRIENTYEITEYEPNKKYSCKSISGPFPWQSSFTYESVKGGTKVTMASEFKLGGIFKLVEPIFIRIVKRQLESDFNNLKNLMETQS